MIHLEHRSRRRAVLAVCFVAAAWSLAVQLESPIAAQEASDSSLPPIESNPQDNNAAADDLPPPPREISVYIPYDRLRETFEKEGRGVFLPYEKFQELWRAARAHGARPLDDKPPVGALITEIQNEAVVGESVVFVTAELKIDLLRRGWHEIPLRLADAAIQSAQITGQPAHLVAGNDGSQTLLVEHDETEPQQIVLELKYAKSFAKSPGRNSVSFQTPQAPVNQWRIRIPEAGVKVNVRPLLAATEIPDVEDSVDRVSETVVLAFVGASQSVDIDWTPKSEGAKGLEALASVRSDQQLVVDDGMLRTRVQLDYEISRAVLSALEIEVPTDQKVVSVFDPNIRQWEVAEGDADAEDAVQRIRVSLFEPVQEKQRVIVELEKLQDIAGDAEIRAPLVRAVGAARQQGVVLARLGQGLRGETIRRTGLLQMDPSEMPNSARSQTWTFSYRYAALPFDLALRVEKIKPRIAVNQLVEAYLQPEELTVDLFALYTIEHAGVFELAVDLPPGFEVREVRGAETAGAAAAAVDFHQVDEGENRQLKVNLSRKALGRVGLFVELRRRLEEPNLLTPTGESSEIRVPLPRAVSDETQRRAGSVIVYGPESLRLNPDVVDGMRSVTVGEALEGAASARANRFAGLRPVLAYAHGREATDLTVEVQRRKPQIIARQLLIARIDSGVVKYDATITYDILYSGVQSLRLDVPAEITSDVHNHTREIRHRVVEPPPADVPEGYSTLHLAGEAELAGEKVVRLSWERSLDQLDVGASAQIAVPRLIPQNVDRAWGQIVVTKGETLDVRPAEGAEGLRPIDARHDLMSGASVSDAAQALEFHDDWQLNLVATRYQLEDVKRTSIEHAVLRMVVTRGEQIAVQALYRMRSARQRLQIELPNEVAPGKIEFDNQPLRINGRPVTLERGADDRTFFVPLATVTPEEPFVLELRYTQPGGASELACPLFPGDPAVQQVRLCVYLPQELANVRAAGPWTSEQNRLGPGWMTGASPSDAAPADFVGRITAGINMQNDPVGSFVTDGTLYVYSTLRPVPSTDGALKIYAMDRNWLRGIVIAGVAALGLLLLWRSAGERLAACATLVATIVLLGAFLPNLAAELLSGPLVAALSVVLAAWVGIFAMRDLPQIMSASAAAESPPDGGRAPEAEHRDQNGNDEGGDRHE